MPAHDLARLSDALAAGAIVVLALALLAYAAELAQRPRVRSGARVRCAKAVRRMPVRVSSSVESSRPAADDGDEGAGDSTEALERRVHRHALTGNAGTALTATGVALTAAATVVRGVAAGRAPWANMYEFSLAGAATIGVVYLVLLRRSPVRDLGVWMVGLLLLTLGLGTTVLYAPVGGLVPVLDSYWLVVHVAAAIIAGALFAVGAVATVADLASRARRQPVSDPAPDATPGSTASRSQHGSARPEPGAFATVAHGVHLVAFPIWTFAVLAGAIWAENAWGRYWGWDPKETWAFITWVFYAAYLHAEATTGRWGRAAGWLALAGFAAYVFNYFGVNIFLPGLHSYAGV